MEHQTDWHQKLPFSKITHLWGQEIYTNDTDQKITKWNPITHGKGTEPGFIGLTNHNPKKGQRTYIDIEIDKRNPTDTILSVTTKYVFADYHCRYDFTCLVPTADLQGIYFSGVDTKVGDFYMSKE